eukprot:TRINITY_DN26326_c0_g1_i1.p2 TRINITY_DN26326_c0_g1~~TRINITY_DN26326_c0_g1_i1.p2  ORF type:complete len:127 (-),score=11.62 TRINITY_DN26326_c0_g1_i1:1-357(-)
MLRRRLHATLAPQPPSARAFFARQAPPPQTLLTGLPRSAPGRRAPAEGARCSSTSGLRPGHLKDMADKHRDTPWEEETRKALEALEKPDIEGFLSAMTKAAELGSGEACHTLGGAYLA